MANDWSGYRAGEQSLAQQIGNTASIQNVDINESVKTASAGLENAAKGLSELADQTEKREDAQALKEIHDIEKAATEESKKRNTEIVRKERADVEIMEFNNSYSTIFTPEELEDYGNLYKEYLTTGGEDDLFTWIKGQISEKADKLSYDISQASSEELATNKDKILDYTAELVTRQTAVNDPNALKPESIALALSKANENLNNIITEKKMSELTSEHYYYSSQLDMLQQNEGARLKFDINSEADVTKIANLQHAMQLGRYDQVASILGQSEEYVKLPKVQQMIQEYIKEVNEYRKAVYIAKSNINRNQAELGQAVLDSQHTNFWARHQDWFAAYSKQANSDNYEQEIKEYADKAIKNENDSLNTGFTEKLALEEQEKKFNRLLELNGLKSGSSTTSSSSSSSSQSTQGASTKNSTPETSQSKSSLSNDNNNSGFFDQFHTIQSNNESLDNMSENKDPTNKNNDQNEKLKLAQETIQKNIKKRPVKQQETINNFQGLETEASEKSDNSFSMAKKHYQEGNYGNAIVSGIQGIFYGLQGAAAGLFKTAEQASSDPLTSTLAVGASSAVVSGTAAGASKFLTGASNIPIVKPFVTGMTALAGSYLYSRNLINILSSDEMVTTGDSKNLSNLNTILTNDNLSSDEKMTGVAVYLATDQILYNQLSSKEKNSVETRNQRAEMNQIHKILYPQLYEWYENKLKERGYLSINTPSDQNNNINAIALKQSGNEVYNIDINNPNNIVDLNNNSYSIDSNFILYKSNNDGTQEPYAIIDLKNNAILSYDDNTIDLTSQFRAPSIVKPSYDSNTKTASLPISAQGIAKSNQASPCIDYAYSNTYGKAQIRKLSSDNTLIVEDVIYNETYYNNIINKDKNINTDLFKANLLDVELLIKFGNLPQDSNYTTGLYDLAYIAAKNNVGLRDVTPKALSTGKINDVNLSELEVSLNESQEELNNLLSRKNSDIIAQITATSSFGQLTNNGNKLNLMSQFGFLFNNKLIRQTVTESNPLLFQNIDIGKVLKTRTIGPIDQLVNIQ